VYERIRAFLDDPATRYEQYYLDICRQYGKTFIGVLVAIEHAMCNPGSRVLYTSATRSGLWQFVQPNVAAVLADCPPEQEPHWSTLDSAYHFANGAQIHLAGVNNGHENDARGPSADLIVNEEAAFVDRLDYLVTSVELPMLTTTGGRILHITTPPETPAHEVTPIMERCRTRGNYVRRTIEDNRHLSDGAKTKLIGEMGGRESTKARRELWCEWVVDESRAICPEYTQAVDDLLAASEPPAPTYEQPVVAMDVGFEDWHHILFGYYHFKLAKRVVQAEVRLQRATTDKIAAAVADTEEKLWGPAARKAAGLRELKPAVRWSDTDLRLIADLDQLHRLGFNPTEKDDKEAQVNALRISVRNHGWWISPSCTALRRQLRLGVWNKQRTEFDRSKEDGHFDAVDAAIYFHRNLDTWSNPYPAFPEDVIPFTHHIPWGKGERKSETAQAFEQAFGRRR
jgi:hypothetical protein